MNDVRIRLAQRACEAAKARQAVVVFIYGGGEYAVASYGETRTECAAVKPLCNAIADALDDGALPMPGGARLGGPRESARQREVESLTAERDGARALACELAKRLDGLLIATAPGLATHLDHEKDEARALLSRAERELCTLERCVHG